ncbi:signal peptidase I [Couchioplanes caeruleus subsp. caeruleus]|uniref:Signal peptidase I n=2 Tax=Couchioplanes caeruleus TaxID=56438 RepID=A0A1K0GPY1_9ACTN|nr:signal peptidase I [Couchioplanes caeruleus subsp. caeruleus]
MCAGRYAASVPTQTDSDKDRKQRSAWSRLRELLILAVVGVLVAVGVRAYVLQTFYIPSGSMEQTLLIDDKVLVDKISYRMGSPERGEIVVFRPPSGWTVGANQEFIKRVVGVAGDRVVCCDGTNRITVNGRALDEDYLFRGDGPSDRTFDVTVPAGSVFLLGDHRSASADSRAHLDVNGGTVPVDNIVGRAFATYWPPSSARMLSVPETFADVPAPH